MIKNVNKKASLGQTSLILILLAAAALIFFAITLNWGRVAQTKAIVTMAADQAAALLASDVASYGEMEKQSYLQNSNQISSLNGIIMAAIAIVVAIICLIITITSAGAGAALWIVVVGELLAVAAVVMAIVNLCLQICVVQPGITKLWTQMQKEQPIQQQFLEGAISEALQASVTDQVPVTDYFDLNTNGLYGINWATNSAFPNDTIPRFAMFYTDRLRMLNSTDPSSSNQAAVSQSNNNNQTAFFLGQVGEFVSGETCGQNAIDNATYPGIPLSTACPTTTCANGDPASSCPNGPWYTDCPTSNGINTSTSTDTATDTNTVVDPNCYMMIPNGFQLNDPCPQNSSPGPGYSVYCDPCCQPFSELNPNYKASGNPNPLQPQYKLKRPLGCAANYTQACLNTPGDASCICNTSPNDSTCIPTECISSNNPYYNSATNSYPFPYLYDPTYQGNYATGSSFLEQFGRDQQWGPFTQTLTAQGSASNGVYFPNGAYPFFWEMNNYSPEVDNITSATVGSNAGQVHWCAAPTASNGVAQPPEGYNAPNNTTLGVFPDLAQLNLTGYSCTANSCCVGWLSDSIGGSAIGQSLNTPAITINAPPSPLPTISLVAPTVTTNGLTCSLSWATTPPTPNNVVTVDQLSSLPLITAQVAGLNPPFTVSFNVEFNSLFSSSGCQSNNALRGNFTGPGGLSANDANSLTGPAGTYSMPYSDSGHGTTITSPVIIVINALVTDSETPPVTVTSTQTTTIEIKPNPVTDTSTDTSTGTETDTGTGVAGP